MPGLKMILSKFWTTNDKMKIASIGPIGIRQISVGWISGWYAKMAGFPVDP